MSPRIELLSDWPQPDTVSSGFVAAMPLGLFIGYGTGEESFAVVRFERWTDVRAGGPNDEALYGHPLYKYGLKHYSVHRIDPSPWLVDLEKQNSVHPRHSSKLFMERKVHYLFALKEETVECIVVQDEGALPDIRVFDSQLDAIGSIARSVDA